MFLGSLIAVTVLMLVFAVLWRRADETAGDYDRAWSCEATIRRDIEAKWRADAKALAAARREAAGLAETVKRLEAEVRGLTDARDYVLRHRDGMRGAMIAELEAQGFECKLVRSPPA